MQAVAGRSALAGEYRAKASDDLILIYNAKLGGRAGERASARGRSLGLAADTARKSARLRNPALNNSDRAFTAPAKKRVTREPVN